MEIWIFVHVEAEMWKTITGENRWRKSLGEVCATELRSLKFHIYVILLIFTEVLWRKGVISFSLELVLDYNKNIVQYKTSHYRYRRS